VTGPPQSDINWFVQGEGDAGADTTLGDFRRFPTWMWRNREMRDFIVWLRAHNAGLPPEERVGVYGLDLYSMHQSADAAIRYLEQLDPQRAAMARERYAALDHVREPQAYGYATAVGARPDAREGVVAQLLPLRTDALLHLAQDGLAALDAQFFAQQNAKVVVNAENYYRSMFGRRLNTWNLRDAHMYRTLAAQREVVEMTYVIISLP
jgi:erythromycin esterase-like protein